MRTHIDAKTMAKSLRQALASRGISLPHGECLEIVAQEFGFGNWNILAAKLSLDEPESAMTSAEAAIQPPIPILKVSSLDAAGMFYVDFLGCRFDWGHEEGSTYAQVSRSGLSLHLNAQSRLNGSAGMLLRMEGLDALHSELVGKVGPFSPSEISFTQWDSRVFHVIDPFGNALQFWENNPRGAAKPLERPAR